MPSRFVHSIIIFMITPVLCRFDGDKYRYDEPNNHKNYQMSEIIGSLTINFITKRKGEYQDVHF